MDYPARQLLRIAALALREGQGRLPADRLAVAMADALDACCLAPDAYRTAGEILRAVHAVGRFLGGMSARADYLILDLAELPQVLADVPALMRRRDWLDRAPHAAADDD